MNKVTFLICMVLVSFSIEFAQTQSDINQNASNKYKEADKRQAGFYLVAAEAESAAALPATSAEQQVMRYDYKFLRDTERGEPRYLLLSKTADVPLMLTRTPELQKKGENGFPELRLELMPEASSKLEKLTREHLGGKVVFVIDGEPVTLHKIRSVITGGQFRLSRCTDTACQYIYGCLVGKKQLVPTVTIPAPPGSKGFGMPQTNKSNINAPRRRWVSASVTEPREIVTTTLDEMSMSDPYIFPDKNTHTYYLTSSGGSIYKSKDLKTWTGPYGAIDVTGTWMEGLGFVAAAEIHEINGKYYYAATWTKRDELVDVVPRRYNVPRNQTQILVSDKPEGPYKHINSDSNYDYLYHNWDVIDGTLWVEDGIPYMIFVHEWTQVVDGTMEYVKLSPDLSETISEPKCLFRASEAPWALEMVGNGEMTFGMKLPGWVTDGPELFRTKTGKLGMLWATWGAHRYLQGVAYSESGTIDGPWIQEKEPLKEDNSGHGMMFTTFEGKRLLVIHHAEGDGPRKPQLYEIDDSGDKLILGPRYNP